MKKILFGVFVLACMACLGVTPAHAQLDKITLFGGYAYGTNNLGNGCCGLHGYSLDASYDFTKNIALEANFSGHNGNPTTDIRPATSTSNGFKDTNGQDLYVYTFGPKISLPLGNFSLFTHFLVGANHVHEVVTEQCLQAPGGGTCFTGFVEREHGSGMAFKTGAGMDWNHGRWGLRILEVDFIHPEAFMYTLETSCPSCAPQSFTQSGNNFELSTGITFHLGGSQ